MEIRAQEQDSILLLTIRGGLDTLHAQDLEKFLESKMGLGYRKFLLDLSLLESLSSGGIAFFARIREKSKVSTKIHFALCGMNEETKRIFRFFGLDKKIPVFKSKDQAKDYLTRIPLPPEKKEGKETEQTKMASYSTKKEKIQFYYKGHITPTNYSLRKGIRKTDLDKGNLQDIPVSSLEPVLKKEPEAYPQEEKEEIYRKLESKIEELKNQIHSSNENLEKKLHTFLQKSQKQPPEWNPDIKDSGISSQEASLPTVPPGTGRSVKNDPGNENQPVYYSEIIYCGSCGTGLRVSQKGKYKCPSCGTEFYYKGLKSLSYLEKLK